MSTQDTSLGEWEVVIQDLLTPVGLMVDVVRLTGRGAKFQFEPFTYALESVAQVEALIH